MVNGNPYNIVVIGTEDYFVGADGYLMPLSTGRHLRTCDI
jgi:hypothetical protein